MIDMRRSPSESTRARTMSPARKQFSLALGRLQQHGVRQLLLLQREWHGMHTHFQGVELLAHVNVRQADGSLQRDETMNFWAVATGMFDGGQ